MLLNVFLLRLRYFMSHGVNRLSTILPFGMVYIVLLLHILTARDIYVLSKCLVFFQFNAEDMVEIVYAYPCTLLLYYDCLSVKSVVIPFPFAVGDCFAAFEGDLYSVGALHSLTSFKWV